MISTALFLATIALAALALTAWWALVDHLIDRRADRRLHLARQIAAADKETRR